VCIYYFPLWSGCLIVPVPVEIHALLSSESKSRQFISDLATESSAFKKAYSSAEKDRKDLEERFEKFRQEMEQEKFELQNQLRVGDDLISLILCLNTTSGISRHLSDRRRRRHLFQRTNRGRTSWWTFGCQDVVRSHGAISFV
jgi:hypothetical protein